MEAKEKAKELLNKMSNQTYKYQPYAGANYLEEEIGYEAGKKCALICIDERIEEAEWWSRRYKADNVIKYLKEIKTEIEKL